MAVSAQVQAVFEKLLADENIQKALAFIKQDEEATNTEQKEMALISGAPFTELEIRSPMYLKKLQDYGLADCAIDEVGNTFGYVYGNKGKKAPLVLMEGHLDTVFPIETPLAITEKDGRIYCPGIGDDTAALATLLCTIRAIRHANLKPCGTLMLGGTVGEEAPGLARGVIHLMETRNDIDAYIAIETCWTYRITTGGIACIRFECTFRGPGGHSWMAYGLPSPLNAAGRAIAAIADLVPPKDPKTICNVGLVQGGTSVNSIANETTIHIDVRSVSEEERDKLAATIVDCIEKAVVAENAAFPEGDRVTVNVRPYNSKPGGQTPHDSPISQVAWAATEAVGVEPRHLPPSSTNANFPIAKGIPALCIGAGGDGRGMHSLEEWYDPTDRYTGAQKCLLMLFALAGLDGVTEPLV